MPIPRRLIFQDIAPQSAFHAARLDMPLSPGTRVETHCHDFYEMLFVLEGSGEHPLNGTAQTLTKGRLVLIRPDDEHGMRAASGERLTFINIAFPAASWQAFQAVADIAPPTRQTWQTASMPPVADLALPQQEACAGVFQRALRAYHAAPSGLNLCRFWSTSLPFLLPAETRDGADQTNLPLWLARACESLQEEETLRQGLPAFVTASGVSLAHLSRTLKTCVGQTPTEYINGLRVKRAATLLATTSDEIASIALDCGFENLSYFYRQFRQCYGTSPRQFRLRERAAVAP